MATETMEKLIKQIAGSEVGMAALEDIEADRLARRQSMTQEIAAIREEINAETIDRNIAVEKAEEKYLAAEQALSTARQELLQAKSGFSSSRANHRISNLEGELRKSADMDTLHPFLSEMDELFDKVRAGTYTRLPTTERTIDGHTRMKEPGNAGEVRECLSQIGVARREAANNVVLEPLDKAGLESRLNELWLSIVLPKI